MRSTQHLLWGLALVAFATLPALGQTPTGTLTGRVVAEDGSALPGVTVTVTSPSLQGSRVAVTSENGDYNLRALPPGQYTVRFELAGLAPVEEEVRVALGQTATQDAQLTLEEIREEIVVTSARESISSSSQAAVTYSQSFVESLPVARDITQATLLSPAAGETGPGGNVSISGNMSFENLYLVNGVVITDNIRSTPFDLFIEDAIEETTVSSSGISAEYGRFGGGVINTITKSGGNEFHGSLRANVDNQSWEGETPLTVEQDDTDNFIYEGTLGGRVWRDHLWFFLAARDRDEEQQAQTAVTDIPYDAGDKETRLEGKLTFSPTPSHRVVGTYLDIDEDDLGNTFSTVLDLASVNDRKLPQELMAFHYAGVLSPNFSLEGQYSERQFLFQDSGSKFTDRILGTLFVDADSRRWHSPTFCGVCRDEERSNENLLLKASYFLSTPSLGSHDLVVGYDTFEDIRAADNHQSGSDFRIVDLETLVQGSGVGAVLSPHFIPGTTFVQWNPIFETTRGTAFKTNSFFLNDAWRVGDRLSVNLGVRYDQNDGEDASRNKVIDDSKVSPRLGASYDIRGDGDMQIYASFGRFVNAIANDQAGAGSAAGSPAAITWFYEGPEINGPGSPLIPADEALQMLWDWFDARGGTANLGDVRSISIPGGSTVIGDDMSSPHTDEYSLGVSRRLGTRGTVRADYVHREGGDFYIERLDLGTGRATLPSGDVVDRSVIGNEDDRLERVHDGLYTVARYRLTDQLELGGTWAWSHTRGTWDGETANSGPVSSALGQFPEYKTFDRNLVRGDLENDQRHRVRVWAAWDLLEVAGNQLNLTVLQNFATGTPYGAAGSVATEAFVDNPGYVNPPSDVDYFFTGRDAFRTDDITRTDLALNYAFDWNAFGKSLEVFLQPEVTNVFNEDGVIVVNTSVRDATTSDDLQPFNPFTETPVEGVHWEKGPDFGEPSDPTDFQTPRIFRFSVGFRF